MFRRMLQGLGLIEMAKALEFHAERNPFRELNGFIGYLDSVAPVGAEQGLFEVRGWLVHKRQTILALTLFSPNGTPTICDYGLVRLDLAKAFPHLAHAALCGFRTVVRVEQKVSEVAFTFQAVLSNDTTRFGSLEPVQAVSPLDNNVTGHACDNFIEKGG